MTFLILAIIVIIVAGGKFFYDSNKIISKAQEEGRLSNKHPKLINLFIDRDPNNLKIIEETTDTITLGVSYKLGTTLFFISFESGKILIQWKEDHAYYGNHKIKWKFNEEKDEKYIVDYVMHDITNYLQDLMDNK